MRIILALIVAMLGAACAVAFDPRAVEVPQLPAALMEVDTEAEADEGIDIALAQEAGVDLESAAEMDTEAYADVDVDAFFSSENVPKGMDTSAFDNMDWASVPNDRQLPGDLVKLTHAPGAVPEMDEDEVPKALLPADDAEVDENQQHDIELWGELSKKIKEAQANMGKYRLWNRQAALAVKKVKAQLKQTRKNHALIKKAIRGLIQKRRASVKKLKEFKLKADLAEAKKKLATIDTFGQQIVVAKASLGGGSEDLERKVKILQNGLNELRTFGQDH